MSQRKLRELIEGISVAMLTTVDADGLLRSRPLMTLDTDDDDEDHGELWFFTAIDSGKIEEIQHDDRVNLSYAEPDDQDYVSISGRARIVEDREKIHQFWRPAHKAWFPEGPDDPKLALLCVEPIKAEYWDAPGSAAVTLGGMAKAIATGQSYRPGENEKLNLSSH